MGYTRKSIRRRRRALTNGGLGPMFGMGDLSSVISSIENSIGAGLDIASDPYLPEVLCHVGQLHAIQGGQPVPNCPETPDGLPGGVGLNRAVYPLRWYVYAQQNPWVYPLAAAVIIGLPMLIGYELGKD
ncbi:MAG TPA: hypothetical protein VGM94_01020 [Galbitalea sp.]